MHQVCELRAPGIVINWIAIRLNESDCENEMNSALYWRNFAALILTTASISDTYGIDDNNCDRVRRFDVCKSRVCHLTPRAFITYINYESTPGYLLWVENLKYLHFT
jgi:hypothetical protein